jgi:Raf kinase inhibitor-like YbhB/YbcL family protein
MMPMMRRAAVAAVLVCVAGCGGGDKLKSPPPAVAGGLTITSPDFPAGGAIPARFSCDGAKARPALRFGGVPAGAAELALVVVDPDAGGFVHWTAYGLPPATRALASTGLPAGALEGENSTGKNGWTPPCPPKGTHRYEFRLYWLKRASGLKAGAKPDAVIGAVRASAGGSGLLVGRYERR